MSLLASAGTPIGNITGIGQIANVPYAPGAFPLAIMRFVQVVSNIVGVLTLIGGIWFIFQIVMGAISWISSGGDKQSVENARKRITNAILGLGIAVMAYTLIIIVGLFLGIDILNLYVLILSLIV